MRKLAIVTISALLVLPLFAQTPALQLPAVSQHASVTQTVGLTDITITYSRPGVKGRTIFGGLVPYGQVWRTGANTATQFVVSTDVTIEGQKLPAGTYSLHTIPTADQWTLVFNTVANQWGSFNYDAAKDALRVTVKPMKSPVFTEWLSFDFPRISTDEATVVLRWADVMVPFHIGTNTTALVLEKASAAVAAAKPEDWQTRVRAGTFAMENGQLDQAQTWSDAAVRANENMTTLWLRARILQKRGRTADAITAGELALAKKTDKDNKDLATEIRKEVDAWKGTK
jgi:hypothetical protein